MKLSSWNVNGLRAVTNKKIFPNYLLGNLPREADQRSGAGPSNSSTYDIVFLMETKSELDQLPESVVHIPGYSFHLQHSNYKRGYAGVAMYIHESVPSPAVSTGWSHACDLDDEQRIMTVSFVHPTHGSVAVTGCYFPNGARGVAKRMGAIGAQDAEVSDTESNLDYKLKFFDQFRAHMNHLSKSHDHVLVCGDINIAHHPIDLARPDANKKSIGFLPVERSKLDEWQSDDWVDVWRAQHGDRVVYSWWDVISRARTRNVGWRIDAWWTRARSLPIITSITYDTDQMGSDHCPVVIEIRD